MALLIALAAGCSSTTETAAEDQFPSALATGSQTQTGVDPTPSELLACDPFDIVTEITPMANALPSQQRVGIQLTLKEHASPCVISGHPNVEFIGGFGNRSEGEGCAIVSTGEQASPVALSATTGAHAVITFLDSPGETPPDYMRVELPGLEWGKSFRWELGTVLCHNAATHPGTYVGTIQPGPVPTN